MSVLPPSLNAVLTDSAKLQCLNALLPAFETWSVMLLSDLATPTQQQTIWTITESSFPGYARVPITNASAAAMGTDGHAYSEADAALFTNTGTTPVTVKGWGYVQPVTYNSLKASGVFAPWKVILPGHSLALIPLMDDTSWAPCPPCVWPFRQGLNLGDRSIVIPYGNRAGYQLGDRGLAPPWADLIGLRLGDRGLAPPWVDRAGFHLGDRSIVIPYGNRAGYQLGDRSVAPPGAVRSGLRLGDRSTLRPEGLRGGFLLGDRSLSPPQLDRAGFRLGDRSLSPPQLDRAGFRLGDRSLSPPAADRAGMIVGDRSSGPPSVDRAGLILRDRSTVSASPSNFDCTHCPDGTWTVWQAVISGGTPGADIFNGTWLFAYDGSCVWDITNPGTNLNAVSAFQIIGAGQFSLALYSADLSVTLVYFTLSGDCVAGFTNLASSSYTGSGTPGTCTLSGVS
jgi:hypothetical protein